MKFNKWTLGLAALGAVSLTSAAHAEEKMNAVSTAVSGTTISGYIDTSMQWNPGTGNENLPGYAFGGAGKADGFNLNVFQLTVSKALDESEWASGYRADLWFGPDANSLNTASLGATVQDIAIRQAYVALRTPVGNGIDWKVGVFDTILGYETLESGNNPNMTRSYGFTLEPTTQTGLLASYRFTESIEVKGGIVNTVGPTINSRSDVESYKAYTGAIALTAPSDWGWLAGSSLYGGILVGFDNFANAGAGGTRDNYYVGATVNTPVTGLKAGISFDYAHMWDGATTASVISPAFAAAVDNQYAWALYLSYQATEKMSLHGRAETIREQGDVAGTDNEAYALTGTVQYNLWENVISRVEVRWDHANQPSYGPNGAGPDGLKNEVVVAANIIYKF
ncbi:MAG TPA: outer membrane beta-barrel protein [Verrucomicrobiae bacterium]|nr:outer membrane beta-barrel protein [Verrucomicrobiae bacterium]